MRLYYEEPHYVLLTGEKDGYIYLFDSYYEDTELEEKDIQLVLDEPTRYNRIVPIHYFNRETEETYALGPIEGREAVLLFNNRTQITPEETIEYFI